MHIQDGMVILNDFEQMDADLADDSLRKIVSFKEDGMKLFEDMRRYVIDDPSMSVFVTDINNAEAVWEEQFDDIWHKEWHRLIKISGSVEWTTHIPSCEFLHVKIQLDKKNKALVSLALANNGINRFRSNTESKKINEKWEQE